MQRIRGARIALLGCLAAALAGAPAASAGDRAMAFSGRCPIDVIFPLWVDADRARQFVPPSYSIATEAIGKALVVVSLVACEDIAVDGVTRSHALFSDLLFQVNPPPGSGTAFVDQKLDGYWAWVVTDEPRVHAGLSRLGMFHGFDPNMSVTATRSPVGDRLLAVDGSVAWPHAPFRLHGDVVDATPLGWPEYYNHFWQDVRDGRLKAKLTKLAGENGFDPEEGDVVAEELRAASFTLTTLSDSRLAFLLGNQCVPDELMRTCSVSGPGAVTQLPHFEYDIDVLQGGS